MDLIKYAEILNTKIDEKAYKFNKLVAKEISEIILKNEKYEIEYDFGDDDDWVADFILSLEGFRLEEYSSVGKFLKEYVGSKKDLCVEECENIYCTYEDCILKMARKFIMDIIESSNKELACVNDFEIKVISKNDDCKSINLIITAKDCSTICYKLTREYDLVNRIKEMTFEELFEIGEIEFDFEGFISKNKGRKSRLELLRERTKAEIRDSIIKVCKNQAEFVYNKLCKIYKEKYKQDLILDNCDYSELKSLIEANFGAKEIACLYLYKLSCSDELRKEYITLLGVDKDNDLLSVAEYNKLLGYDDN